MTQQTADPNEARGSARKRAPVYLATTAIVLSGCATAIVLGNMAAGVPRQADEGASAHLG